MNKTFKTNLIISMVVLGFSVVQPINAQEQIIDVEVWDGTKFVQCPNRVCPSLFFEEDFLPGDESEGLFRVTNLTGEEQPIAAEFINYQDPSQLGQYLNFVIEEGDTTHYSGNLLDFSQKREFFLSNLGGNQSTQYKFIVIFPSEVQDSNPEAPNTIQGKSLSFDILIGAQGTKGGPPPSPPPSGGGVVVLPRGLTILEESATTTETTATSVTIIWTTSYLSTSQVIYSSETEYDSGYKFNLSQGPLYYGYAHFVERDDSQKPKVTGHSVTITGLTPGTTYYYRAVSHGSLAISREYSFTTLGVKEGVGGKEEKREEKREEKPAEEIGISERVKEIPKRITEEIKKVIEEITPSVPIGEAEKPSVLEEGTVLSGKIIPPIEIPQKRGLASILAAIGMTWGGISKSVFLTIVVILCLVVLILIGIREWRLFRKKRKK